MEWISVNDRLPEKNEPVLVYEPDNKYLRVQIDEWTIYQEAPVSWSSATIETGEGWAEHEYEQVTHWMPLPEAPKD